MRPCEINSKLHTEFNRKKNSMKKPVTPWFAKSRWTQCRNTPTIAPLIDFCIPSDVYTKGLINGQI